MSVLLFVLFGTCCEGADMNCVCVFSDILCQICFKQRISFEISFSIPQDWTLSKLMTCHALNWNFIDFGVEGEARKGERRNPL